MQVCSRCLYTSRHPLYLTVDENGLCSGCRVHEEKDAINWEEKQKRLKDILEKYRNRSGNNYDCIVPVSGAGDSYFIVHVVKNIFGLNPLLVTYNKQYNTDVGVRNLANLRIKFNCDIMTMTVNPHTVKKITRASMRRFGSIYWHCIAGQTVYPVQMAVKLKIPLIIWGAHQGVDQVGMFSHHDEVEMSRKYRKEHDLMGYEAEDLISDFDGVTMEDINPFKYPHDEEIAAVGVRGIYLNNFIRWDSLEQHNQMVQLYGYESTEANRTFDPYNHADCFNYTDVHDYIKVLKLGYGKATDHACREIRLRKMTREEAMMHVAGYQRRAVKNLKLFVDWLGITENSFHYILDQHRNPLYWKRDENWQWAYTPPVTEADPVMVERNRLQKIKDYHAAVTDTKRKDYMDNKYILIGKGYYE